MLVGWVHTNPNGCRCCSETAVLPIQPLFNIYFLMSYSTFTVALALHNKNSSGTTNQMNCNYLREVNSGCLTSWSKKILLQKLSGPESCGCLFMSPAL